MEKLLGLVKKKKYEMLLYWIIIIILLYSFFAIKILSINVTKLQLIFVGGISIIVYTTIVVTMQYISSQKKLKWVNSIYDQFVHMQIFLDNNNLILEIFEGEIGKLENLARVHSFQVERISNKNDLVKVLVK